MMTAETRDQVDATIAQLVRVSSPDALGAATSGLPARVCAAAYIIFGLRLAGFYIAKTVGPEGALQRLLSPAVGALYHHASSAQYLVRNGLGEYTSEELAGVETEARELIERLQCG